MVTFTVNITEEGTQLKQTLNDSIKDFLEHLKAKDLAKESIRAHDVTLRRFLTVTGNILTENVTEGHVDTFFVEISKTRGAASRGIDTTVLRGFFKWAIRTRRASRGNDPMADRKSPKVTPRQWRGFPVSKLPALLDAAQHPRDRMLLALGAYLLGRSIEFRILRVRDVDLDSGYVSYQIPKTKKVDLLPISVELDEELRQWLTVYAAECGTLDPNWYLVPAKTTSHFNGHLGYDHTKVRLLPQRQLRVPHTIAQAALGQIGMPLVDEDGKTLREGMHTIRRSMARALFEQLRDEGDPNPIETVRAMLNHATEAQTRTYIGLESGRVHRDARLRGRPMFPGLRPGGNLSDLDAFRSKRAEGAEI